MTDVEYLGGDSLGRGRLEVVRLVYGMAGIIVGVRTSLLFVRHGESDHSVEGFLGGPRSCRGLTDRGREQVSALADRFARDLHGDDRVSVHSSVLRRAVETAQPIAAALGARVIQDCRLCTWHLPAYADGLSNARFHADHAAAGAGVFRPFEHDNETWAELVVRTSQAIMDIAHAHRGATIVLVGHSETVDSSFHALAAQPLYRAFDLSVAPASVTEWAQTTIPPAGHPPAGSCTASATR